MPLLPQLAGLSYHDADATVQSSIWQRVCDRVGWGDYELELEPPQHQVHYGSTRTFSCCAKISHFLLAPEEVSADEFGAWLPPPGQSYATETGSFDLIVCNACNAGDCNTLEPEAFEALGRHTGGVESAKLLAGRFPFNPMVVAKAAMVTGRCLAALGRLTDAREVLAGAIPTAGACHLHLFEIVLMRDLIVWVLDHDDCPDGRGAQLPALCAAVRALPADPQVLVSVLGSGLGASVLADLALG